MLAASLVSDYSRLTDIIVLHTQSFGPSCKLGTVCLLFGNECKSKVGLSMLKPNTIPEPRKRGDGDP